MDLPDQIQLLCEGSKTAEDLRQIISAKLPNTKVMEVAPAELPCFSKVILESTAEDKAGMGYISNSGNYIILGIGLDLQEMRVLDNALTGTASSSN